MHWSNWYSQIQSFPSLCLQFTVPMLLAVKTWSEPFNPFTAFDKSSCKNKMNPFETYLQLLLDLRDARKHNDNEDDILDAMDQPWWDMSKEEQEVMELVCRTLNEQKE